MPKEKFIIAGLLIFIASCTQDLAKIEIHNYKASHGNIKKVANNKLSNEDNYIYVEYGETIYSLAIKHNVSYLDLAEINNLAWPYSLEIGQKLYLTKPNQIPNETNSHIDTKIIDDYTPANQNPATTEPAKKIIIESAVTGFKWPINGKIISYFGSNDNGTKNDGIYIETQLNKPVKATASGTVIYAGQDLEQYGNLLIISHKDQYFSAYAHLSELKVTKNSKIQAGDIIALTGDTGNISSPQLYFSLRKNKTPVDPLKYLPKIFSND